MTADPRWSIEQVVALARTPARFGAGESVAVPASWSHLGASTRGVWGRYHGRGAEPYEVAADHERALAQARAAAAGAGGWMLRETGAPGLDGFGIGPPNARLGERVRAAFDPTGKCSPGRLPRTSTTVDGHDD